MTSSKGSMRKDTAKPRSKRVTDLRCQQPGPKGNLRAEQAQGSTSKADSKRLVEGG